MMGFHQLLELSSEEITRRAAKTAGIRVSGAWTACEERSKARVTRHAVLKNTHTRVDRPAGRLVVDISGSFHQTSLGGKSFGMVFVDDFYRFKVVVFRKHEDKAAVAL